MSFGTSDRELYEEDGYPTLMSGYRIIEDLGEGCFAKVQLAEAIRSKKKVALKMVNLNNIEDKEVMACAQKEYELARRLLRHKNIVQTFTTFKNFESNTLVMVMEYMPCGDLEHYIHSEFLGENKLIPEFKVWYIFEQIAGGIEFMHEKKIIHRDLKPANCMIGDEFVVKVGDFGLSRMRSAATIEVKTVCGTPYYMSPERILQRGYTYASDVWSLGCLLYELATAVSPFFGERHNSYSLSKKVETADYPPVPEDCYSVMLNDLIKVCLTSEFEERPSSHIVHEYSKIMVNYFKKHCRERALSQSCNMED
ncbi:unnamed protein product [Bursaphelenchus okinawaensis]|uniref:non-specific serine/threonine protein kinase n=1 Tax=Bursaphelenchus okinawaensis TaxID=465554 RepID=A0A811KQV4_9BILA|nr:unnamed protein product [Bursaphelenchus okinawaensis]CAG9112052.1 unnamed protein product [Bursaphelenchus okinawaensis]